MIEINDSGICIACGIVDMRSADFTDAVPLKGLGIISARGVNLDPGDTDALGIELTLQQALTPREFLGFISSDDSGRGGIYLADPDDVTQLPAIDTPSTKVILSDMEEGDDDKGTYRFMIYRIEQKRVTLEGAI